MEIKGRESPTNRIWYCRKVLRIKQGALAKKIGCARSTLSSWESGHAYPPVDMAVKLAKWLKCPLEDLYPNLFEKNLKKNKAKRTSTVRKINKIEKRRRK